MDILYIGHFSNYDGYAKGARDYVDLLCESGHKVDCFDLNIGADISKWGERWVKRTQVKLKKRYSKLIVHKPPHEDDVLDNSIIMTFKPKAKTFIWITIWEAGLWPAEWEPILKLADVVATSCLWQVEAARKIHDNVFLLPYHVETELNLNEDTSEYKFYSEFSRLSERKGLDVLLNAYFMSFTKDDKVSLTIKIPYHDYEVKRFHDYLEKAKKCFHYKKDNLPKIELCYSFLTDEQMDDLMNQCHTYICSSKAEGFSIPLAKAAMKGKNVLFPLPFSHHKGAHLSWCSDYIDEKFSYDATMSAMITDEYFEHGVHVDTSKMFWLEPSTKALSYRMRNLFGSLSIGSDKIREYALNILDKSNIQKCLQDILND